ncbi:DDE superfamily endonuclease domain-containing protein [Phthorimaea operculella]|nr:DDE superfamily endonuclease domain-containing protein [Phthorimaea operculella]
MAGSVPTASPVRRGKTLNSQAREFVVKLRDYFERESMNGGPLLPVTHPVERVAAALGIGVKTVISISKEKYGACGSEDNELRSPKKRKITNYPVTGIDNFDADAIRQHVYNYYTNKQYPTRTTLLLSLREAGLFHGGKSSLSKILNKLGFHYKKVDQRKVLMERYDITLLRNGFLREAKKLDLDNVVFLDETWLNANHTISSTWTDDSAQSTSKVPMGKGGRLVICHAGSAEKGFIQGNLLAFASKKTSDYHEEMDADRFEEWFRQLLISLDRPSVILMDNAPYHSRQIDRAPTQNQKKANFIDWLLRHNIEANQSMLKAELVRMVKLHKPARLRYVVDEMALEYGHRVVRLPPYHCQYNAIELIWAQIKGHAGRHNTEPPFTTGKMMELLIEACSKVTKDDWANVVKHTKKIIDQDFERDVRIDNCLDNEIIIRLSEDSSDSEESSSSEEE